MNRHHRERHNLRMRNRELNRRERELNNRSVSSSGSGVSAVEIISAVVHILLAVLAIYLSIKCNNGFNLGDFLLACCCPMCYVPIRLAISGFCQ